MVGCQLNADVGVGAGVCLFFRSVFMFDYWLGEKTQEMKQKNNGTRLRVDVFLRFRFRLSF